MADVKFKWLKFRVTPEERIQVKNAFEKSGSRYFWQWCRRIFIKSVKDEESKKEKK